MKPYVKKCLIMCNTLIKNQLAGLPVSNYFCNFALGLSDSPLSLKVWTWLKWQVLPFRPVMADEGKDCRIQHEMYIF